MPDDTQGAQTPPDPAGPQTLEQWAKAKKTPPWAIAGAKVANGWGIGQVLTEAEFDAGLKTWSDTPLGGPWGDDDAKAQAKAAAPVAPETQPATPPSSTTDALAGARFLPPAPEEPTEDELDITTDPED